MRLTKLFLFCFLITAFQTNAQESAVPDTIEVKPIPFSDFTFFNGYQKPIEIKFDTALHKSFFYDKLKYSDVSIPRSGGPGSASLNIFELQHHNKTLNDGFNQFDPYILTPFRNLTNDISVRRFTGINYHLGSKKEQHVFIQHQQKIKPWFIAGIDFGASTTQGDFARQLLTNRNFSLWMAYQSPSNVYRSYLNFTSNRIQNQENGGITVDTIFENASSLDTRTLPINLDNASIRHKTRDYVLKQDINLTNLFANNNADSSVQKFNTGLVLSQSLWWKRKSVLYQDQQADIGYYQNDYLDTLASYDSTFYNDVFNELSLSYTFQNGVFIGAGARHQYVSYFVTLSDTFINTVGGLAFVGFKNDRLFTKFTFVQNIGADINEGYTGSMELNYLINSINSNVYLHFSGGKVMQSLRDRMYFSNHFIWNNNFEMMELMEGRAGIVIQKIKTGVHFKLNTVKNIVFYREDFLPQVYGDFVSYGEMSVTKSIETSRIGFDNKIVVAHSSNENVVRVPLLSLYSSLFYKNRFFKNALGFRAGADVVFNSEYQIYGYMPATGVFYLQNEKKTGNYPLLGLFVNLKIKSADLFVRLDHFNAGLSSREYYGANHYPLPGRTIKFGVNWNFTD